MKQTPLQLPITLHERYDSIIVNKIPTAPLTIAPPKYKFAINYNELKKIPGEKEIIKHLKKELPKTKNYKFSIRAKIIL